MKRKEFLTPARRTQKSWRPLFALLSTFVLQLSRAEEFALDWALTANGTDISVGGNFELTGTVGQNLAGIIEGDNLVLESGFWSVIAESSVTAPDLNVSVANGQVIVEWDSSSNAYLLEETSNLSSPLIWNEVPGVVQNRATINPAETLKIYRLRRLFRGHSGPIRVRP